MPDGTTRFKCKGKDILHFVRLVYPSYAFGTPLRIDLPEVADGYLNLLAVHCRVEILGRRYQREGAIGEGMSSRMWDYDWLRRCHQIPWHRYVSMLDMDSIE